MLMYNYMQRHKPKRLIAWVIQICLHQTKQCNHHPFYTVNMITWWQNWARKEKKNEKQGQFITSLSCKGKVIICSIYMNMLSTLLWKGNKAFHLHDSSFNGSHQLNTQLPLQRKTDNTFLYLKADIVWKNSDNNPVVRSPYYQITPLARDSETCIFLQCIRAKGWVSLTLDKPARNELTGNF